MATTVITEAMVLEKEKQNAARRKALNERRQLISSAAEPDPNFPPECLCVKPVIYHNIREQVPVPQQRFMYILSGLLVVLTVIIIYNIVAASVLFVLGGSAMHLCLSFLYLLGIPGAWIVWYYNVYCAVVYSSRPRQLLAFFGLFVGVLFDIWMAVGVIGFGGCGWIVALDVHQVAAQAVAFISAILWSLHAVALCVIALRFLSVSSVFLSDETGIYRQSLI